MSTFSSSTAIRVGMVLFPNVTQLDITGPYEVFARMPYTRVQLVAATVAAVRSEHGLTIVPDVMFDTAPWLDVICVPGGVGVNVAMKDEALLYRFVTLFDPCLVLVKGGAMFPEATIVRLEGATAGGSALKGGWILVGFYMELWLGPVRVRSSPVRSVSIESVPAVCVGDGRAHA